ncbi:MAG: aspartate 1-decarboxylase [Candidatus Firestonebacteria bacterium]
MFRIMCKSKIHRVTVTEANLNYVGSLSLDGKLMEASNMLPYENVHILNLSTGDRIETYVIPAKKNSGVVCLNGPAARLGQAGDKVIIISYALFNEEEIKKHKPVIVFVNDKNKITNKKK